MLPDLLVTIKGPLHLDQACSRYQNHHFEWAEDLKDKYLDDYLYKTFVPFGSADFSGCKG